MKDTKACIGCRNNFYNGNNTLGVKQCWNVKGAKIVKRKKIAVWAPPVDGVLPGHVVSVPNCYHETGYVFYQLTRADQSAERKAARARAKAAK